MVWTCGSTRDRVHVNLHTYIHGHETVAYWPVGHEADEEADNGVDDPAVEAPVVQRHVERLLRQLVVRQRRVGGVPSDHFHFNFTYLTFH